MKIEKRIETGPLKGWTIRKAKSGWYDLYSKSGTSQTQGKHTLDSINQIIKETEERMLANTINHLKNKRMKFKDVAMQNEIEKLIRPRYEVIADYPGSPYEVGQILDSDLGKLTAIYTIDEQGNMTNIGAGNLFELYPHLFREMKWWEKRTEEEMPRYVKLLTGSVVNVIRYDLERKFPCFYAFGGTMPFLLDYTKPATEAEYKGEGKL